MIALLERLLPLWTEPVDGRGDPEAAFGEVYADPVVVNGTEMSLTELVARARSLQQAFDRLSMDILDTVETPERVVVAFEMRGRHVGPYASPLGTVAPTGRDIAVRTIDVLTIAGGLVTAIWVVADDLGLLRQLDAARLNGLRGTRQRRGPPHRLSDAVLPPRLRRLTRFARARHTDTEAGRPDLIHIRHRNLEFPATASPLASGSGAANDARDVDHDGAPGKIRYLRWVTPGASTARTCSSRTSASPRLSRGREPPPSNTGTTCSSSSSSRPAARYCWTT